MCNVIAGQDPGSYAYKTRSVRLAGYATSIRLEAQFWEILDEIAAIQGMTTPRFLARLYEEALEIHGEVSNFTSLLRNACVLYLKNPDAIRGAADAPAPGDAAAAREAAV
ncbi:Predicted DNA-binding protein, contains Ribbon-helix-helix (RHH) domain [Limimonas halophila]|uniref:Predicted DNA-binding protein, contains Ribbon-helix-helix (RHH) domain n=1 Tax=Limimonas halophila TaxID=1082479 RepID=A0A1G7UWZ9_9PROT|nr:ribbon-helix-helix domain-containing protein [Limimonas halophila]SDG51791.1 Predicted DNA-binding protein, contains Ribbon-helix-helix (RHH) domain [Limimonas halophila]